MDFLHSALLSKNINRLKRILEFSDLDIIGNKGRYFTLCIMNDSPISLEMLIQYYTDHKLSKYDENSTKYKLLKVKLTDCLRKKCLYEELSENMKLSVMKYVQLDPSEKDIDEVIIDYNAKDESKATDQTFDIGTKIDSLTEENLTKHDTLWKNVKQIKEGYYTCQKKTKADSI